MTGKVRFGDDSRIDIKGKGSILFISQNGAKKVLADVYYIPDLKSNIISLGQATASGCEVKMRGGYLTLHDKEGKLIVQAQRSANRLYKVLMDIVDTKCLKLSTQEESSRWHARLGHIGASAMKLMMKEQLVVGLPKLSFESETCESCLLGKQARHSFPKSTTFRAEKALELVHGDYMWSILLKEKSEAFEKLKMFKTMVEGET